MYYSYTRATPRDIVAKEKQDAAERLNFFRKYRDQKLAACDWTQLADAQLTETQKAAWATYRQALRDMPANATPDGYVKWPKEPSFKPLPAPTTSPESPIVPVKTPKNVEQYFNLQ